MTLSDDAYLAVLREHFMTFAHRGFIELVPNSPFMPSPYIDLLASVAEECRTGGCNRLIVNLPPRTLKSRLFSVALPAFILGHNPFEQIICASYGHDLSLKHARDTLRLVNSNFYKAAFPATRLSQHKKAAEEFETTLGGFRMATSIGGVLTGRGADWLILDDPMKPDEAMSETLRNSVNDWFFNTLLSRLNNKEEGKIIILMQRLHQDDLVGRVLEKNAGLWKVVSLPAIAEEDESHLIEDRLGRRYFRRLKGEALHPERESVAILESMRETIGAYNFAAQYQQEPIPEGGAIIQKDWLRFYCPTEMPQRFWSIYQSWDTAIKSGELNDYTVCTTWGAIDGKRYLLDVFRKRLDYPQLRAAVLDLAARFRPNRIVIEDRGSGTQLLQELPNLGLFNLTPYLPTAGMDKIVRLYNQSAQFEGGKVFLSQEAPWLAAYVQELLTFPGSRYDDQVDSTTQALESMRSLTNLEMWARLAG